MLPPGTSRVLGSLDCAAGYDGVALQPRRPVVSSPASPSQPAPQVQPKSQPTPRPPRPLGATVGCAEEGATLDVGGSEAAVVELDVYRGSVGLDVDLLDGGELDPGDRAARSHT